VKAYLEVSAINHAIEAALDAGGVRLRLDRYGYTAVVGLHVIYESAMSFLKPSDVDKAKNIFRLLRDLDPSYSPDPANLHSQEVAKLRTGAAVLPFLNHHDQVATRVEIHRLAEGIFDDQARRFISMREGEVDAAHPQAMAAYIAHVNRVAAKRAARGRPLPPLRTFDQVWKYFEPKFPDMLRAILHGCVSRVEAREISQRLGAFPALRGTLAANLYFMFICIAHRVAPGLDKVDDYRHLVEAVYCDTIVTLDTKLRRAAGKIAPHFKVLSWADLN
jgi:hypothetical protein